MIQILIISFAFYLSATVEAEVTHEAGQESTDPLAQDGGSTSDKREACLAHKQVIEKAQLQRQSMDSILRIAARSDIIFIGESHFEYERDHHYRHFLKALRSYDSQFNCVFIESEADNIGGRKLEQCNEDSSLLNKKLFDSNNERACEAGSTSWNAIQNEAYRQGVRVFAIDAYDKCSVHKHSDIFKEAALVNNCRDRNMQQSIQKWINSGKCKKAISINGAPHITSIFEGHDPLGQKRFYDSSGQPLNVFNINFVFDTYESKTDSFDPRWRWMDWRQAVGETPGRSYLCSQEFHPKSLKENYGFLNKSLGVDQHPYFWINDKPVGNWLDFDATIVIGQ